MRELRRCETAQRGQSARRLWCVRAVRLLRPLFRAAGHPIPRIRVFVSDLVPPRSIAYWWSIEGRHSVLLSSRISSLGRALDCLIHESIHAATGEGRHDGAFAALCLGLGYTTPEPNYKRARKLLRTQLARISRTLGTYPVADAYLAKKTLLERS